MTEPLTLVVYFDVSRTSPNRLRRQVWQERKREADAAKEAATLAWRLAGSPVVAVPVAVSVTIRRGRELDGDNAIASIKSLVDGLFVGRITPDDSQKWVELVAVRQEIGAQWKEAPEVVFRVFPRETAPAAEGGATAAALSIEGEGTMPPEIGWGIPRGARFAHYWPTGNRRHADQSACGKWKWYGPLRHRADLEHRVRLCVSCAHIARMAADVGEGS